MDENIWETWVGNRGIVDDNKGYQYFNAVYWALQTTSTVGYGDFTMTSLFEYIYAVSWMLIGCNLFSFTIGSVGTMIAGWDDKERKINNNINTLIVYSKKYGLPKES